MPSEAFRAARLGKFAAGKRLANLDAPPLSPVKQRETRLAARRTTKLDLDLFHTEVRMAADVARTRIHPSLHFGRKWTPRCISKGPADTTKGERKEGTQEEWKLE